jgi:hypothetical protein
VFSLISAFVGLSVRDPETAQLAGFAWVFPLTSPSPRSCPRRRCPASCAPSRRSNPVTLTVNAARALTTGHGDALSPALGTLAWLAGLLLIFVPLTVRLRAVMSAGHATQRGRKCSPSCPSGPRSGPTRTPAVLRGQTDKGLDLHADLGAQTTVAVGSHSGSKRYHSTAWQSM